MVEARRTPRRRGGHPLLRPLPREAARRRFPVLSLPYAELAADPAGVLASTCHATGLPYEPGQERFWTTQHHNLFGSVAARRTLQASDATIRRTEPSQEFLEATRTLAARAASDPELAGVIDRMRACAPS